MIAGRLFALADFGSQTHEFGLESSQTTRTDPSLPAGWGANLFEGQREKLTYLGGANAGQWRHDQPWRGGDDGAVFFYR